MATIKLILQLLVYTSVFTISTVHQVCGDKAKGYVVKRCFNFIKNGGAYRSPDHYCLMACTTSNMISICRGMTAKDQKKISMAKLFVLHKNVANRCHLEPNAPVSVFFLGEKEV